MSPKKRPFPGLFIGVLAFLSLLQTASPLGTAQEDLAKKYPEAEGLYEMTVPGQGLVVLQVYFKDGTLRTVTAGDADSTTFSPVEGHELRFMKISDEKGTYLLELLKDEQGRLTRFRVVNEKLKLDVTGVKKAEFDDAKADPASPSDRQGYFERHYRKSEHRVPMRDGILLFTQVFSPVDASELHPLILFRTPYGISPYGKDFPNMTVPSLHFLKEGYILVFQDIRGRAMSEGTYEYVRPYRRDKKGPTDVDESSDAYDTVDWLLKNVPGTNGKVGVWGISYPGFTAAMAAIAAHPAVLAVSPQAPMADIYMGDDALHNGALYLAHYANYAYSMGQARPAPTADPPARLRFPTPDGYSFYLRTGPLKALTAKVFGDANPVWNAAMAHETYDDYWKALSVYPHLGGIKPAILTVGGWYDAEDLGGTLGIYKTVERLNPGLPNTIVMGPWGHSRWNHLAGGSEAVGPFPFSGTRAYFQDTLELPFFNHYLKGKNPLALPEAVVFETGTDQWRTYDAWPPADSKARTLFLADGGRLSAGQARPDEQHDQKIRPLDVGQLVEEGRGALVLGPIVRPVRKEHDRAAPAPGERHDDLGMGFQADRAPQGDEREEALEQDAPAGIAEGRPFGGQPAGAAQPDGQPEQENERARGPEDRDAKIERGREGPSVRRWRRGRAPAAVAPGGDRREGRGLGRSCRFRSFGWEKGHGDRSSRRGPRDARGSG